MSSPMTAFDFLGRQEINYTNLANFVEIKNLDKIVIEQVVINAKYFNFIEREKKTNRGI